MSANANMVGEQGGESIRISWDGEGHGDEDIGESTFPTPDISYLLMANSFPVPFSTQRQSLPPYIYSLLKWAQYVHMEVATAEDAQESHYVLSVDTPRQVGSIWHQYVVMTPNGFGVITWIVHHCTLE